MTRTAKSLRQVLIDIGFRWVPDELIIDRLYPGLHQRAMGAWRWSARGADGIWEIGSCETVTDIISAHRDPEMHVSSWGGPGGLELFAESTPGERLKEG